MRYRELYQPHKAVSMSLSFFYHMNWAAGVPPSLKPAAPSAQNGVSDQRNV